MNEADKKRSAEQAAANRAHLNSPEMQAINNRLIGKTATLQEACLYVKAELLEAMDSLPPSAPDNARTVDGFHASCAVFRALCVAVRIEDIAVRAQVFALPHKEMTAEDQRECQQQAGADILWALMSRGVAPPYHFKTSPRGLPEMRFGTADHFVLVIPSAFESYDGPEWHLARVHMVSGKILETATHRELGASVDQVVKYLATIEAERAANASGDAGECLDRVALLHQLMGEWVAKSQVIGTGSTATLHEYLGVKYEDYVRWIHGELSSAELYDLRMPGVAP